LKHPDYIYKELKKGECIFYGNCFKRPVYYYPEDGLYRLLLDDKINVGMTASLYSEFIDTVNSLRKNSEVKLVEPILAVTGRGIITEVLPAKKVRILEKRYQGLGDLYLDESPRSMSVGLGILVDRSTCEIDNTWWQKYLSVRKRLLHVEQERYKLAEQLFTLSKGKPWENSQKSISSKK
jgi:hypothetical protein